MDRQKNCFRYSGPRVQERAIDAKAPEGLMAIVFIVNKRATA